MTLLNALSYLLERHGYSRALLDGKEITDWLGVSNLDPVMSLEQIGAAGTWPRSNDCIILMQMQDTEDPFYIDSNGFQRANMLSNYYPVVDWTRRLVHNTATGKDERLELTPTSWAQYTINSKVPITYDSSNVKVHDDDYPHIEYERFSRPRRMYVSKLEGANKVDFGRAGNWNEIGKSVIGHVDYGTEIYILGQARHPMPPNGGVFYMDAAAMGTFSKTGRAAHTHGYSKSDLNDHLFAPTPEPERVEIPVTTRPPDPEPIAETSFDAEFKNGYKGYRNVQGRIEYRRYVATNIPKHELFTEIVTEKKRINGEIVTGEVEAEFAWIRDLKTDIPRRFRNLAEVDIAGEFYYKDKLWGMPAKTILDGDRFGIDMDWLVLKSELYSTATTREERKVTRTLKPGDYLTSVRGITETAFNKAFDVVRRNRKQKIKQ